MIELFWRALTLSCLLAAADWFEKCQGLDALTMNRDMVDEWTAIDPAFSIPPEPKVLMKVPSAAGATFSGGPSSNTSMKLDEGSGSAMFSDVQVPCSDVINQNVAENSFKRKKPPVNPTTINVKAIIMSLNDVSDIRGVITLATRFDLRWYDNRLAVESEVCIQQEILVNTNEIWFPYFIIQNSVSDMIYPEAWQEFPSSVRGDGLVQWRVALRLDLSCEFDLRLFPFDVQYCTILLQSPHYNANQLNYTVSTKKRAVVILSANQTHPTFSITGQYVYFSRRVPGLQFWIRLERNPTYYIWTIFIPTVAVAVTTGATFIIPAHGEEKMSTAITGLLGYFFLFGVLISSLPQASQRSPVILPFYMFNIMLSVIVIILTAVSARLLPNEPEEEGNQDERSSEGEKHKPVYFNKKNSVDPLDPPSNSNKTSRGCCKRFKPSLAKWFNDFCFIGYFFVLTIAYVAFGIYMAISYDNYPAKVPILDVNEYIINE